MKVTIEKGSCARSLWKINRGESIKILSGRLKESYAMVVTKVDHPISEVPVVMLDEEFLGEVITLPSDTCVVVVKSELKITDPFVN